MRSARLSAYDRSIPQNSDVKAMQEDVSVSLFLVDLNHARDVDVEQGIEELSWAEFAEKVKRHRIRDRKDGPGYIPAMMKLESEWQLLTNQKSGVTHYRGDINIEALTVLVIDIDQPGALEKGEQIFEGYEYIVHSTHNYTPETPWKYRMIVRLAQPILVEDWPECFEALKSRIDLDPSCCNPSRFYYYPSHSASSNIGARNFHQKGRAITKDEIIAMGQDVGKRIRISPYFSRTMGTLPLEQARVKRHFSGKLVAHYDTLPQSVNMSTESFYSRHMRSIVDFELSPHSRHNFALSVTGREYYMMGPRADLRRLLDLMFQIAAKHGTPLESGANTIEELPEMIISAMAKYAPEALILAQETHGEHMLNWVVDTIDKSLRGYESAPPLPEPEEKKDSTADMYDVLRKRHIGLIREFMETGDYKRLVSQVMRQELRNENPDFDNIAKALFRYRFGYLTQVSKMSSDRAYKKMFTEGRLILGKLLAEELAVNPQKLAFSKSALLVEIARQTADTQKNIDATALEPGL